MVDIETALITWWTVAHTLSGFFFGALFNFRKLKKISFVKSATITLFLLILWEYFERYVTYPLLDFGGELIRNRIADVIIGFLAFVLMYFILKRYKVKILQ